MEIGKLFNADGRIGRKDLIVWVVGLWILLYGILAWLLGAYEEDGSITFGILAIIAGIAGIFMGIKRLHDLNKTGWLYLIAIIPIVSFFFMLYLWIAKGDAGDNQYGAPNSGSPFPALH